MNDDHGANTISMVKHYVGVDCTEANIVSMDSLGMMVKAKLEIAGGGYNKIRYWLKTWDITTIHEIFILSAWRPNSLNLADIYHLLKTSSEAPLSYYQ